jgi:hypothetical protein
MKKPQKPQRPTPSKALVRRPAPSKALVRRPAPPSRRRDTPTHQVVLTSEQAALLAAPIRAAQERAYQTPPPAPASHILDEDIDLTGFATEDPELTEKENAILDEPVREEDVQIKPTGQIYLSHPTYTRWLNRALGRLKWKLEPATTVAQSGGSLIVAYFLVIRGKKAAIAYGEQAYHEDNKDQTKGDAVEATVASALRRCCKRLGVGLELWERDWAAAWVKKHAVKVYVKTRDGRKRVQWRKKNAEPFWNEVRAGGRDYDVDEETGELTEQPPAPTHGGDEVISEGQRKRLWAIAQHAGRSNAEVKGYLALTWGVDSSSKILRKDYDAVVRAIEAQGPLVEGNREPGQEG